MKKLFIILVLAIALIIPVSAYAEPDEAPSEETSNWEIIFTVKYNSKDRVVADKLIADIMKRHEDACDVKIDVKRLSAYRPGVWHAGRWHSSGTGITIIED